MVLRPIWEIFTEAGSRYHFAEFSASKNIFEPKSCDDVAI
jgi:hypothetical protein